MSDVPFEAEDRSFAPESNPSCSDCASKRPDCNAVCIDAARVYDSCGSKDCLRNLQVYFTDTSQATVENACAVRVRRVSLITATVEVEPLPFHKGYYAVDVSFYFAVTVELSVRTALQTLTGLAIYNKRVVLFGGDGCVRNFASDDDFVECLSENDVSYCVPRATLQTSNPIPLSARIINCRDGNCPAVCGVIPECVRNYFGATFVNPTDRYVAVTIGMFSITQIVRNVQILIPSYDYCIPRRECNPKPTDPCEAFSKIDFPTDAFFPSNSQRQSDVDVNEFDIGNFECDCDKN